MLILAGRYLRDKPLPPTCENCPRCRRTVQWNWRRMYKTAHFFFFPLFSFSESVVATCSFCGYATLARHPWPMAPLSFFDRCGFLVPVGAMGLAVVGFFVLIGVAVATAPPPVLTAETQERERIEQHLGPGQTWGEGPGAEGLAKEIASSLVRDEGFVRQDLGVVVTTSSSVPRRIFIECQYASLADVRPKGREELVRDLREVLDPKLGSGDHVVIAVKGVFLYGILAHGTAEADWDLDTGNVTREAIDSAMREPALPPAPVSSTTISSADLTAEGQPPAPSAAPSASAAPAPSSSAAPPPKKKKKKAKPVEQPKPEDPLP